MSKTNKIGWREQVVLNSDIIYSCAKAFIFHKLLIAPELIVTIEPFQIGSFYFVRIILLQSIKALNIWSYPLRG